MKKVEVFKLNNGKIPLQDWLDSVKDKPTKARILERIKRLSSGNLGDYKKLDFELSELRLQFGAGYRIYFSEIDNIIVLLISGGDKSTQTKDIQKAKEYLTIYKESNK
ncbi:MAG TPA: addiction module protein [Cyanobacteria bacterium UBA9971]|nr:addiction module protein [Cyanobacteria bacterium UBA9971]